MLIEFRVENHRSLRDEQALTMEASRLGDSDDSVPRKIAGYKSPLLPAAVIYGANASGKSNVLSALDFMALAVLESQRFWDPGRGIPRDPFAWENRTEQPSTYEASFILNETKFSYGFTVNDLAVMEEWLFAWPQGRKQVWFEREGEEFKFGDQLQGPNGTIREVTRPDALFLSVAAQHSHRQLSGIYHWFHTIDMLHVDPHVQQARPSAAEVDRFVESTYRSDSLKQQTLQLLQAADRGIVDIQVIDDGADQLRRRAILLKHRSHDENSWLNLWQESLGMQSLFCLATGILSVLQYGGLVLIDELESSLHPLVGQTIVELFNNPSTNPANAQLIFTTHDTNLLGNTLGEPALRRDQIWFTEKDNAGATRLYPLTDYKPRKAENLERGYLQGRYGAIPYSL